MKSILIIGCGYLGSHLANFYFKQGWKVKVVGKRSNYNKYLRQGIHFFEMDILDSGQLHCLIEQDDVVLCATGSINATNIFSDVIKDINEYYISFVNLLNECANKKISKFVFLSSAGTVYGDKEHPAREEDCLNPENIYGLQKVYFEHLIKIKQIETSHLPYVILRVSNPYGGIQNPQKNQGIIPILINRAIEGQEFNFWGDENSVRDFIYIDDFLEATYLSTVRLNNEVVNIARGESTSIKQVIQTVQEIVGRKINIVYTAPSNKVVINNRIDNSKLRHKTGYTPTTPLYKGISIMVSKIVEELE